MKLMESSKLERPGLRQVLPLASTEYQTKEDVKPKSRYNDQICVMGKKKKKSHRPQCRGRSKAGERL